MLDLRTVYQWLPNVTMFGSGAERFTGISTDSRTVRPGYSYIALRFARFVCPAFIDTDTDTELATVRYDVSADPCPVIWQ